MPFKEDITIIIKTIERPIHLNRLIESIKKFYPDFKVIVADDSKNPVKRDDVEYHILPYDVGVSAGRNYLIERVKTKYYVLLDDDYIFTGQTKLEKLYEIVEKYNLDLLAGAVSNSGCIIEHHGTFFKDKDIVSYSRETKDMGEYHLADIVPLFFIAKTDIKFDPQFKTTEHFDFLYTLKQQGKKVGFIKDVIIDHEQNPITPEYTALRQGRRENFFPLILKKHNLKKLISFNETIK